MRPSPPQLIPSLTRRRVLQGTLSGVARLTAWQPGWPWHRTATAQHREPRGQMTWAIQLNIAPTWFDPAETPGIMTPYIFLYALHDALVKPMPAHPMAPSLATAWHESSDGLTYDFALRQGVTFHNGDPFTADDVHFSFERYKGAGAPELKHKVKAVEIVTPYHVHLHAPWPDFLTFYATPATGVGWIVPKRYTEQIGSDKFKEHPVGLGPYRFVHYQPGVALVLEAHTDYWRQVPHVKRLVLKSVPEATTRLAMLKQGEADVAFALYGAVGEEVRRDPHLKLEPVVSPATQWLVFTAQQYDPASPGPTNACAWRRTTLSIGGRSTRRRRSGTRSRRGISSRASSKAPWRWSPTRTIPRKPGNSSPRPATPTASKPGTVRPISLSLASLRRLSMT